MQGHARMGAGSGIAGKSGIILESAFGRERKEGMRNVIVLAAGVFVLAGTLAEAAGPIGWWKLDEKEGTVAKDSSGNGFDATVELNGGPEIWAPGKGYDANGCVKFTAKQYVLIPDGVWDKVKGQLSIAFWVNQDANKPPDSETWPGPWGCASAEGKKYPEPNWLPLRAFLPTPEGNIDLGKDEENIFWAPYDKSDYAGKWNHYVFVKDVNDDTIMLYHNGELVAQRYDATEPMPKITNFILGGRNYPNADWNGMIDDFRIYNFALSYEDAEKLYKSKPAK
jgi:hypothetical protein